MNDSSGHLSAHLPPKNPMSCLAIRHNPCYRCTMGPRGQGLLAHLSFPFLSKHGVVIPAFGLTRSCISIFITEFTLHYTLYQGCSHPATAPCLPRAAPCLTPKGISQRGYTDVRLPQNLWTHVDNSRQSCAHGQCPCFYSGRLSVQGCGHGVSCFPL